MDGSHTRTWRAAIRKLAAGPADRLTDAEAAALKEFGAEALVQQHAGGKRYAQRRHNEPVQRRRPSQGFAAKW